MKKAVVAVIFEGGNPASRAEELVTEFRKAIVRDNIIRLRGIEEIARIILLTNYRDLARHAVRLGAHVILSPGPDSFHFGHSLAHVVKTCNAEAVLYLGGAAGSLLTLEEIQGMVDTIAHGEGCVTSNNFFSSDVVGFTPAQVIGLVNPPKSDNELASILVREGGLAYIPTGDSVGMSFDVDTPIDAAILSVHPDAGTNVKECVARLGLDTSRVEAARDKLLIPYTEVAVIGRISPACALYINRNSRVRLRLFSEERGMKALGREARGEVASLLGYFMAEVGPEAFFDYLARVVDLAFIDTRVIFAHFGLNATRQDRFNSDLGNIAEIKDPLIRRITGAASGCGIPVLLGGHSLVAGGIRALIDAGRRLLGMAAEQRPE